MITIEGPDPRTRVSRRADRVHKVELLTTAHDRLAVAGSTAATSPHSQQMPR